MDVLTVIGGNIRRLRRKKNMTIEQLAEKSFISAKYLQRVEVGRRNISVKNLQKVAKGLDTTLESIVKSTTSDFDKHNDKIFYISEKLKVFSKNQLDVIGHLLEHIDVVVPNEDNSKSSESQEAAKDNPKGENS